LLRALKRDEATTILRKFLSEYSNTIHHVSLIKSENHGCRGYRLQIGANLNRKNIDSLRELLKLNGYVMEEWRGFILIDDSKSSISCVINC
jgi:hypothetical protein